jgi:hypothetical protein
VFITFFQSLISSSDGLAHPLNTLAISLATAYASTVADAKLGLPVMSAIQFLA